MKFAGLLLGTLSLALVLWLAWRDFGAVAEGPGPLHPAHAQVAELQGAAGCARCHEPGAGATPARCAECHPAIGAQWRDGRGLHGALAQSGHTQCAPCHGEHHGGAVALLPQHAFVQAGLRLDAYDHRHSAGFALAGAHSGLACVRCHPAAEAAAPPSGGRFLGLRQECMACHEDPHRQTFGDDCQHCHGQQGPWRAAPGLRHPRFELQGAHARVACAGCHAEDSAHSVAAERSTEVPVRACRVCHADPHRAGGQSLQLAAAERCERCHGVESFAAPVWTPERHAAVFALRSAHANTACADCHGGGDVPVRWRGPVPEPSACSACHTDPHGAAVAAVGACADCHDDARTNWPVRVSPAQHAALGQPLAAPHADVACQACHRGATYAARYPGRAAADCRACHADVHGGQFARHGVDRQCTDCHLPTSFVPAQFGVAAHATTAWPLTGAHEAVACAGCHREVRPECGRRFRGTATECHACHADPHRGRFERPGLPAARPADPRQTGCARCHDTGAFAPVQDFDHALWTGYELVGAHQAVACAGCHPRPVAGALRLGQARGSACADCHADPHAGQFAVAGRTDCARCHTVQSFTGWPFDHGATRFPLDAVHAGLACRKCHRVEAAADGTLAVRYRPLGVLCGDCHTLGGGRR